MAAEESAITVTIVLRRPASAGNLTPAQGREEIEKQLSASAADLSLVRKFASEHGLTIIAENAATRTVRAQGSPAQMTGAFGAGQKVPAELSAAVLAILGLDQRPIARPRT